jgi:hypothetical protein
VGRLYSDEMIEDLIEESPAIAQKRKQCELAISALTKAHQILAEVRDFNVA